jgi:hypothetical protein
MKNEIADDVGADVAASIEQLRAEPLHEVEASAEDIGDRIADKLDAEDEARAVPPVGETRNIEQLASQRRDAKTGRFASTTRSPSGADAEAPAGADQPSSTAPAGPPPGWSQQAKSEFSRLSPAVQEAVLRREQEVSNGFKQYSEKSRAWDSVDQIMGPRRPYLQQFGFRSDQQAIEHMLLWSDALARNPAQAITDLANHLRVNIGQQQQPQMSAQEAHDMANARAMVQAYEANPPPHYQTVRPIMKSLLEQGVAADLKDAYNKALAAVRSIDGRGSVTRKIAATNASLSGAPHGSQNAPARRNGNGSHHSDIVDDVRAAMSQVLG